ncbi:unnamed protein product [Albugo candida]|uniref:ubiquitinyl hydrolase 1 n=1 Tax=Albugo candida TaxID=65357 RepID=A0A024GE03_9STRA|nr:unnamed protein product [Albugo candida]|eukprot:CCI44983.1 unnamed protein product [Albugo candida]
MGRTSSNPTPKPSPYSHNSPPPTPTAGWNNEKQKRRKKSQDEESDAIASMNSSNHNLLYSAAEIGEETLELYQLVAHDLKTKSTVGWQNAVESLNAASAFIHHQESQSFLSECFNKIVSIMLDQHLSKIGGIEKQCVNQCLSVSIPIILHQLQAGKIYVLQSLVLIFNKKRTLYKDLRTTGVGSYWNKTAGAPEVRAQCINVFCELKGFDLLVDVFRNVLCEEEVEESVETDSHLMADDRMPTNVRESLESVKCTPKLKMSGDDLKLILQALMEYYHVVPTSVITQLCVQILGYLSKKNDTMLRKETNEAIGGVIVLVRRLVDAGAVRSINTVNELWLDLTCKYLRSQSLPLRLFGLEQIHHLVSAARTTRSFPQHYIVRNAGSEMVNGVYNLRMSERDENMSATYVMRQDDSLQSFTLSSCTTKHGEKWWSISEVDAEYTGSERDIDYYQQRSHVEADVPPTGQWEAAPRGAKPTPEVALPVTAEESGGEADSAADTEMLEKSGNHSDLVKHDCGTGSNQKGHIPRLDQRLCDWVEEKDILVEIFGDRVHREVVSRSTVLVTFLAESNRLSIALMDLIWEAGSRKDSIIASEIHQLLVAITPHLDDDLLLHLLDSTRTAFFEKRATRENLRSLLVFVEQLLSNEFLSERSSNVISSTLRLLWTIQVHCSTEILGPHRNLCDILQQELRAERNEALRNQFLNDCITGIKLTSNEEGTREDNPMSVREEPITTSKSLEMLKFLIDAHESDQVPAVVEALHEKHGLVSLLFDELAAFVTQTPEVMKRLDCYRTAIGHRLELIHYIHVKSTKFKLSIPEVERLWQILSSSASEQEFCLIFFNQAGSRSLHIPEGAASGAYSINGDSQRTGTIHSLIENDAVAPLQLNVCVHIFTQLLCKQTDFTTLGTMGYKCFHTFFAGLNSSPYRVLEGAEENKPKNALQLCGLDALWLIALESPNAVANLAIQELLCVYKHYVHNMEHSSPSKAENAIKEFLEHVFTQLESVTKETIGESDVKIVDHCASLLSGIVKYDVDASNANADYGQTPHGLTGRGAIFDLKVLIQRMVACGGVPTPMNPPNTNVSTAPNNTLKQAQNGDKSGIRSIQVQVYAHQPLGMLRLQLEKEVGHPSTQTKILCNGAAISGDEKRIADFNITEASAVRVLLFSSAVSRLPQLLDEPESPMAMEECCVVSPGNLIARDKRYFDILFDTLDRIIGFPVHKSLWNFLKIIPTNVQLQELVSSAGEAADDDHAMETVSSSGWTSLMEGESRSLHRSIYILQIVDALLLPSELNHAPFARAYQKRFTFGGGFHTVLRYFLFGESFQGSFNEGLAIALRIVKYCLFDGTSGELLLSPTRLIKQLDTAQSSAMCMDTCLDLSTLSLDSSDYLNLNRKTASLIVSEYHGTQTGRQQGKQAGESIDGDGDHDMDEKDTQEASFTAGKAAIFTTNESKHFPQMLIDAIKTVRSIVSVSTASANDFFTHSELRDMIAHVLMHCDCLTVREQWLEALETLCHASKQACFIVFEQVCNAMSQIESMSASSDQFFQLLKFLVQVNGDDDTCALEAHCQKIAVETLRKLDAGFSIKFFASERYVQILMGVLDFVRQVLVSKQSVGQRIAQQVVQVVFDDCLFTLPSDEDLDYGKRSPLCCTVESRRLAFRLLATAITCTDSTAGDSSVILKLLEDRLSHLFHRNGELQLKWNQQNHVEARASGEHVGLKNQGCSCYMNSFLQQIFMQPALRKGLMEAQVPPPQIHTLTKAMVEKCPDELVGSRIALECGGGRVFEATVVNYDSTTGRHTVQYEDASQACFVLGEGRPGFENGRYAILPPELTGTEATLEVVRQLQRTFCYLRNSEMRFFNPKALVDACKCLNLEFSVYQQNDASEFCDKLLDRLETGLKTTPLGPKCLQEALDGKLISQKLPKDCGHRYEREEAFIRLELQIRGKESIQESLASFVEGEVMDGDNKVECELCGTKKAATRRTCFGTLPNLLILHLKRFDLDFTTFETVKLNNRCSFPTLLDMKPYTKVGLENHEVAKLPSQAEDGHGEEMETSSDTGSGTEFDFDEAASVNDSIPRDKRTLDPQFLYGLKGILVHSGVAQGGHYYSFIYDNESERWFRYDDEEVIPFDPSKIEEECFGGVQRRSWHGSGNPVDVEVFSNALMLFYEKKMPGQSMETDITAETNVIRCPFDTEVRKSNEAFLQTTYLYDGEFQEFLREMVQSRYIKERPEISHESKVVDTPETGRTDSNIQLILTRIGVEFLLSVFLHAHEKNDVARWITILGNKFINYRDTCIWFLKTLIGQRHAIWLKAYLFECPDAFARQSFVHLTTRAINAYRAHEKALDSPVILLQILAQVTSILDAHLGMRTFRLEECFMLLRNLAEVSVQVQNQMKKSNMIARLIRIFLGDRSPLTLKNAFLVASGTRVDQENASDYQSLLEAIIAILGLKRQVAEPLLSEASIQYPSRQPVLSAKAKAALIQAFEEFQENNVMDGMALRRYFARCITPLSQLNYSTSAYGPFQNAVSSGGNDLVQQNAQLVLEKYANGQSVDVDGFLAYYTDLAATASKQVMQDLRCIGFGEDLERMPTQYVSSKELLERISYLDRTALLCDAFIQSALEEDAETSSDLLLRISVGDHRTSVVLLRAILHCIHNTEVGWKGQGVINVCCEMLQRLLLHEEKFQDELVHETFMLTDFGLLYSALKSERMRQRYAHQSHVPLFIFRQIVLLTELMERVPAVKLWLQQHIRFLKWMYEWLRIESLKPILGGRWTTLYREPFKADVLARLCSALGLPNHPESRSYLVEGAGLSVLNGIYESTFDSHDSCLTYTCVKGSVDYILFRCCMPSKARRWYISYSPNKKLLGTMSDEDFYFAPSQVEDEFPPVCGWRVWAKNSKALSPAPTVRLYASTVEDLQRPHHPFVPVLPKMESLSICKESFQEPPYVHGYAGREEHLLRRNVSNEELGMIASDDDLDADDEAETNSAVVDIDADTIEYDDSEDEIRASNERFQAVRLEEQSRPSRTPMDQS